VNAEARTIHNLKKIDMYLLIFRLAKIRNYVFPSINLFFPLISKEGYVSEELVNRLENSLGIAT